MHACKKYLQPFRQPSRSVLRHQQRYPLLCLVRISKTHWTPIARLSPRLLRVLCLDLALLQTRVCKDALSFQSPPGLLKRPCLYAVYAEGSACLFHSTQPTQHPNLSHHSPARPPSYLSLLLHRQPPSPSPKKNTNIPRIRLVTVRDRGKCQTAIEPPVPDALPALLLALLARRHAPEPAGRRVVVVLVRGSGALRCGCRECASSGAGR